MPAPAPPPMSDPTPGDDRPALGAPYRWFLASSTGWFTAWGMQQVLFAWLVVDILGEDPAWVGTAQMTQMLPSVGLLLIGGALADRFERRTTLLATHLGASLAAAALLLAVLSDRLSFGWVLLYAATWGSLMALHLPARESLFYDVGKHALSRAVSGSMLVQFSSQAAGNLIVGSGAWLGAPFVIALQSSLSLLGAAPTLRLPTGRSEALGEPARPVGLADIGEGISIVFRSPRLRTLVMLVGFNGFLFLGSYFVLVPILVRDVYEGGVAQLSLLMMMFPVGSMVTSGLLLSRVEFAHRGRAHVLGQTGGALCLITIGCTPPFAVVLAATFVWGLCGGVFLNMGRTLFQEAAPHSHRGRTLSVYTLGLMGMAPLGMQTAGLVGQAIGVATGCVLAGLTMCVLMALMWLFAPIRTFH
jgi:MFS family permease